jgi:hypothetical protein
MTLRECGRPVRNFRRPANAFAAGFRASLRAKLNGTNDPVVGALIDVATSAFVEIRVISALYEVGRAQGEHMNRLATARATLIRALRSLGLTADTPPDSPADGNAPKNLQEWLEDWRTRQKRTDEAAAPANGHSEGAA